MSSLKQEPKIFLARRKLMNGVGERELFFLVRVRMLKLLIPAPLHKINFN